MIQGLQHNPHRPNNKTRTHRVLYLCHVMTEEGNFTRLTPTSGMHKPAHHPAHKRLTLMSERRDRSWRMRRRPRSAYDGVHSAPEAHALSRGQHSLQPAHWGLHEPPRRRPQGANGLDVSLSPDQKDRSRVPQCLRQAGDVVGEEGWQITVSPPPNKD
jgi:hypothetical protein